MDNVKKNALILKYEFSKFINQYPEFKFIIDYSIGFLTGTLIIMIKNQDKHSYTMIFKSLYNFFKNINKYIVVKKDVKYIAVISIDDKASDNFYTCYKLMGVI